MQCDVNLNGKICKFVNSYKKQLVKVKCAVQHSNIRYSVSENLK